MLLRDCAGGVVFCGDKVFLLKNEKNEWVLPKGVIKNGDLSNEVALKRVKDEAGISAQIISTAGRTNYEFFSVTRQRPVCNKITWYIMETNEGDYIVGEPEKFQKGGFFEIEAAIDKVTYSQDKSLLNLSFKRYKELAG